jgi:hypothetical protein
MTSLPVRSGCGEVHEKAAEVPPFRGDLESVAASIHSNYQQAPSWW